MRDVKKWAARGKKKIPERRDIVVGELQQIYNIYEEEDIEAMGLFEAFQSAFYMGFEVGRTERR